MFFDEYRAASPHISDLNQAITAFQNSFVDLLIQKKRSGPIWHGIKKQMNPLGKSCML